MPLGTTTIIPTCNMLQKSGKHVDEEKLDRKFRMLPLFLHMKGSCLSCATKLMIGSFSQLLCINSICTSYIVFRAHFVDKTKIL